MNETAVGFDQIEGQVLIDAVSDEMLEVAAGKEKAGLFTIFGCTGGVTCPGSPAFGLDRIEEEILTREVSDAALETAGKEKAGRWTAFCTGVTCPGSPA